MIGKRLLDLILGGRHLIPGLERDHMDLVCATACSIPRAVDSDIAAADHDNLAQHCRVAPSHGLLQIMDSDIGAFCGIVCDARATSALAADCDIEGLIALLLEVYKGDVFADLDATADLDALILDEVDLLLDDILLELVGRDAVLHHAARKLMLLEYGWLIAKEGQVVGTGQTCRAGTDDCDLLVEVSLDGRHGLFATNCFSWARSKSATNFLTSSMETGASIVPLVQASSQRLLQILPQTAGNGFCVLMRPTAFWYLPSRAFLR